MKEYNLYELKERNLIIFSTIMGSYAYGTSTPSSDVDIRGIFIQPLNDVLKYGYVEQVSDEKNDITYYEIGRFINLLQKNNPNIMEILFAPLDMVQYKDPIFDILINERHNFLSKQCKDTFAGYAITQIRKAKGYNKKINWEESQMKRKTVIDFCYIIENGKSKLFNDWIIDYNLDKKQRLSQEDFGLANIDHSHNIYAMYDLYNKDIFKGIISSEKANDVQLVSIPKGIKHTAYLSFNKDAYSTHCKRYKEYQTWLKERNEDRFNTNKEHGKSYDSKNMMHTFRLLNVALEIANKKTINVRRSAEEIKILMKIRKGEYNLDKLLIDAEHLTSSLEKTYTNSNLPDIVDEEFALNLLQKIRLKFYKLN